MLFLVKKLMQSKAHLTSQFTDGTRCLASTPRFLYPDTGFVEGVRREPQKHTGADITTQGPAREFVT